MKIPFREMLLAAALLAAPSASFAGLFISVNIAPPLLPVYEQPPCPGDDYIWTPGYWAYADDGGYYWVPGTWVLAPTPGYLWTPAWWGWDGGVYLFHGGYWGPHVGFYGGVNYGYGYGGRGYEGGRWNGDHFYYNRSVNNVNVTNIHNTYNTTVVNNYSSSHVSYNGGTGGVHAQPSEQERQFEHENHVGATENQQSHEQAARENPQQHFDANHGHPSVAATARPGEFSGSGVVGERTSINRGTAGAPMVHAPSNHPQGQMPSSGFAPHQQQQPNQGVPQHQQQPNQGFAQHQQQNIQQPRPQYQPAPRAENQGPRPPQPEIQHQQPRQQSAAPQHQEPHAASPQRGEGERERH